MKPDILKRIVRAKYVFEKARQTRDASEEMKDAIALLLMHDSVELLMIAVLDHCEVKLDKKREFMAFWSAIKESPRGEAPDKARMESFNNMRNNFKHHGTLPNPEEVRDLMPRVEGFFENVLSQYCDLDYASVSFVDLLDDEEVRQLIRKAQLNFHNGAKQEAFIDLAFAFSKLDQPVGMAIPRLHTPPKPTLSGALRNAGISDVVESLWAYFREVTGDVNALTLGVDRLRQQRVAYYLPRIIWSRSGKPQVQIAPGNYDLVPKSEFEECVSFVVDYGIRAGARYIFSLEDDPKRQYFIEPPAN